MAKQLSKPDSFFDRFERKPGQQTTTHYCPGCGHGIIHKLLAEAISDLKIQDQVMLIAPVGCSVFLYYYFECSAISAPHGRASAVATGLSRSIPDGITISYQGDGDLAAIGTNEAIHAANRGENMLVLFINNNIYGMTGGQMAPTTLPGQRTETTPDGRSVLLDGSPIKMAEIIASLDGATFVSRSAVNNPKNIRKTRQLIRKGLKAQIEKKGYVFLEILSPCPVNWKKTPLEAFHWIDDEVISYFPLGIFKDELKDRPATIRERKTSNFKDIKEILHLTGVGRSNEAKGKLPFDKVRFKSAGFGGQGILALGLMMAHCAMKHNFQVTWLPSYGPEMRGGVANASVVISPDPIGTPIIEHPNILIAMNKPSLYKFGSQVPKDGIIVFNSSMIDHIPEQLTAKRIYALNATEIAHNLGNTAMSNSIMFGFISRITALFELKEIKKYLKDFFQNEEVYKMNLPAFQKGWDAAEDK